MSQMQKDNTTGKCLQIIQVFTGFPKNNEKEN